MLSADANPEPIPLTDALEFAVADTEPHIGTARQQPVHQRAAGDRSGFQRRFDQRTG